MEWFGKGLLLLLAGLVVWQVWRASRPRLFAVRLDEGTPRAARGVVTPAFLQRVREVASDHGVTAGRVIGVMRGPHIGLEFSRQFPGPARQQLRNWWAMSGWPAPKVRR
jgi:hypothetical protein